MKKAYIIVILLLVITGNLLWIGHNLVFKPSVSLLQATRWTTLDVLKAENVRYVSKYLFWAEEVQVLSPNPLGTTNICTC